MENTLNSGDDPKSVWMWILDGYLGLLLGCKQTHD